MRPTRSSVAIVAALVAAVVASTAQGASTVRPWLAGHGAWNTYSMQDVNRDVVGEFNDFFAGSGLSMNEIHNGFGLGFEAGVDLGVVGFGVGYERLRADTKTAMELSEVLEGTPVEFDYKVPATAFRALVEYRLPTRGPLGVRLGVAGGIVSLAGGVGASAAGVGVQSLDYTGKGRLFEAYGSGEWWAAPRFALSASLGYRHARVTEPELDGEKLTGFSVDYSGVVVRAGFKLALAK